MSSKAITVMTATRIRKSSRLKNTVESAPVIAAVTAPMLQPACILVTIGLVTKDWMATAWVLTAFPANDMENVNDILRSAHTIGLSDQAKDINNKIKELYEGKRA